MGERVNRRRAHDLVGGPHRSPTSVRDHRRAPPTSRGGAGTGAELVLAAVRQRRLGEVVEVAQIADADPVADRATIERVHDPVFVRFLEDVWGDWDSAGRTWDALPYIFPGPAVPRGAVPDALDGRLGYWSFDAATPHHGRNLGAPAWWSARCALAGARSLLAGERSAFALCRPPGHHAAPSVLRRLLLPQQRVDRRAGPPRRRRRRGGHPRRGLPPRQRHAVDLLGPARRADRLAARRPPPGVPVLHRVRGRAGYGDGSGLNRNLPMPLGTGFDVWSAALAEACRWVAASAATPWSCRARRRHPRGRPDLPLPPPSPDFLRIGARIARSACPRSSCFEGGYATEVIGLNVVNVLEGFGHPR